MSTRLGAVVALAFLLLAGCGTPGGEPDVDDRTFVGSETHGFDLASGTEVALAFSSEGVSLSAGCNTMFGSAAWSGATLEVTDLASTEMGCEAELHEQDETLGELLTNGPALTLEGDTLTIEGATITTSTDVMIVLHEVLDAQLEGTEWHLDGLERGEGVASVPEGVSATLRISQGEQEEGEAEIEFGCNSGFGGVKITEDELTFGNLAMTMRACEGPEMEVEEQVMAVLRDTVSYQVSGSHLRISAGDGALHFQAD